MCECVCVCVCEGPAGEQRDTYTDMQTWKQRTGREVDRNRLRDRETERNRQTDRTETDRDLCPALS